MNKIQKFLSKLNQKERQVADLMIEKIQSQKFDGLDVKKLRGFEKLFRARKSDLRIIFSNENNIANILDIGRKNDTTYNF